MADSALSPLPRRRACTARQLGLARQLAELQREVARLAKANHRLQKRLNELESGRAIIDLGCQLMAARSEIDCLRQTERRAWYLDRCLCAAHQECTRLAEERDAALCRCQGPSPAND